MMNEMSNYETSREQSQVKLRVDVGRAHLPSQCVAGLEVGDTVQLETANDVHVDVWANSRLVARGELVELGGKLAVRVQRVMNK